MSLFLSISNLQNYQSCCECLNISDTIERECLSVLHKLHDQVNGLQLVQVVVQPLAKLFNPAGLATLSANVSTLKKPNAASDLQYHGHNNANSGTSLSNASNPSSQVSPSLGPHHLNESDGTLISCDTSHSIQHSRSHSFASSFAGSASHVGTGNSSIALSTSTYMMSPDTAQALIARLDTDRDVNWLMEIIGYGLSMPFSLTGEQDSVKDCCTIYCEWLAAALIPYNENNEDTKYQQLSKLVPVPIKKEPNRYARKMLSHLYNVFLPRRPLGATPTAKNNNQKDEADAILTAVSRQAVLCHRVLRTIENIAHNRNNLMDDETWNHLLALLLTVNDKLLSPPTEPDDIGTQLHDRILGVLFDLMLLACSRSVPDFSLWKTFHEMCLNWRHRPALVEHWRRITLLLTKRLVSLPRKTSNSNNPTFESTRSKNLNATENSISSMNYESLTQTWYRFLNLLGNPAELSDPTLISRTDEFYHANSVLDPRHHPCLNVLPQVFYNSMLGLRDFVESFLGSYQQIDVSARRPSQPEHNQQVDRFRLNPDRPKCNSLLHIFGDWLFSSALIGSELYQDPESSENLTRVESGDISDSMTSVTSSMTATELEPPNPSYSPAFRRKQSNQSTTSSHASTSTTDRRRHSKQFDSSILSSKKITLDSNLTAESFESGQAEAMSLLCKIFASKSSTEDVAPAYLARFYLCIQHCLNFGSGSDLTSQSTPGVIKRQLLASVLVNSTELLQKDLDGINLLIPAFIKAIELVFDCHEKDVPVQPPPRHHTKSNASRHEANNNQPKHVVTNYDLRRACILTLVNLLAYPPHFKDLAIRNCLDNASPTTTFESLQPRLMKLLFVALQTETDATNMQILFGGLSLAIHDLRPSQHCKRDDVKSRNGDKIGININPGDRTTDADDTSHNSFVFNSTEGFLTKSLHVTCYLLINTWRHDNLVSLAALEVLTSVARVSAAIDYIDGSMKSALSTNNNNNNNAVEMKAEYTQTTKWICDYISNQCSRPPPAHSRDMHSTIVAAYQCLSVWFYNHPSLLSDENCVSILMEVIELGVSGQKSKTVSINPTIGVATQTIISKGEKLLKPSSMRVREAAEALLNVCLVRTRLDGTKNIALCDTELDEADLVQSFGLKNCKSISRQMQNQNQEYRDLQSYKSFKYFSDEASIIFSLLENCNQDHVICLIRTPFGKHCWKFDFNYCSGKSRERRLANRTMGPMKRPFQQNPYTDAGIPFPLHKSHNRSIYFNKEAKFFPDIMGDLQSNDLDKLVTSLDDYVKCWPRRFAGQEAVSQQFLGHISKMSKIFSHQVLAEQKVVSEIAASRESTRHYCDEPQATSELDAPRVIATHLGLKPLLLDDQVLSSFVDSINSLDNLPVRTRDEINIFYVRRNKTLIDEILDSTREGGVENLMKEPLNIYFLEFLRELGQHPVASSMSWIDMNQELRFHVPSNIEAISDSLSLYWLENADDVVSLSLGSSCEGHSPSYIFISPMASGLFRIDLSVKYVPPLVDGMILRKSSLSSIVREAISNWCRRRRLDTDSYQPPHVKRRLMLTELCNLLK